MDTQDRRARRLTTTEQHRRFWDQRNPDDFGLVQAWTAGLDRAEVDQAVQLLRKLMVGMPAPPDAAPPG